MATFQPSPGRQQCPALTLGLVEKHLIEFRCAGDLLDRAHFNTRLIHFYQEKTQALVGHRIRVGTGNHKTVVRLMRQGGPDLLAINKPLARASSKRALVFTFARSDPAPVQNTPGTRARSRHDSREILSFCCLGPKAIRVGPVRPSPICPTRPGAPARAYSSKKMTCCSIEQPATVLLGPTNAGPAPSASFFPKLALFGIHMFIAGATAVFELFKFTGEVGICSQPAILPKLLRPRALKLNFIRIPSSSKARQCARDAARHCPAGAQKIWRV